MPSKKFNPATEIPDLSGKTVFVTGGNAGLGASTVAALAAHNPLQIYLTARRRSAAETAVADVKKATPNANLTIIDLDLASLESVKAAAATFNASASRLDLLILNAGVGGVAPATTTDGYEIHMGTNHVGHALLTQLLLPKLLAAAREPDADVRIVVLSSEAHRLFVGKGGIEYADTKSANVGKAGPTGLRYYGQSKLANIFFARKMAQLYPQIKTVAVHPGVVNTSIFTKADGLGALSQVLMKPVLFFMSVTPDEGAKNQLWASVGKDVKSGEYYEPVAKSNMDSKLSKDQAHIDRLWEWTEEELKAHGGPGWADAKSG